MSNTEREYLQTEIDWCLRLIKNIKEHRNEVDALRIASITYILHAKPIDEKVTKALGALTCQSVRSMISNLETLEDRLTYLAEDIWPSTSISPHEEKEENNK